jgi:hypothetical protein
MKFKLGVTFEACFPEEERQALNHYLSGIKRAELLKMGSYFLGFDNAKSQYSDVTAFINMFFSADNKDFAVEAFENLKAFISMEGYRIEQYEIPYVGSSLLLFEFIFDNVSEEQDTTKSNLEIEQDVFKAYLNLNQIAFTDRGIAEKKSDEESGIVYIPEQVLLKTHFHNNELINYRIDKLFTCQFLRAVSYFEFLSQIDKCKPLLKAFYEHYGVKDYNEYLRRLFGIIYPVLMKDKESHTEIHLDNLENEDFIDKHILSSDDVASELDFLTLRGKPLYKFEKGKYRIISPLFTIEMIYNGLYFRLKAINEKLPEDAKVSGLYGLKTYEYSEQYALDTLLQEIYGKSYYQKSGKELDEIMPGAPDYYVRNGKHTVIFESKDILISKESKQSTDFRILRDELRLKLYENEKGKSKAVKQLVESIRKLLNGQALYDKNFPINKGIIFPVLVVHYRMFNAAGLNHIVNGWFRNELETLKEEGFNISKVQDLVLVDMDTLIFNKEALQSGKLKLWDTLKEYQDNYLKFHLSKVRPRPRSEEEGIEMLQSSFHPFSFFLDIKVEKQKLARTPKELLEKATPLFPK